MLKRQLPSKEILDQLFRYEPETGKLFWKERPASFFKETSGRSQKWSAKQWNAKHSGNEALIILDKRGYRVGRLFGKYVQSHRVVFKMLTGNEPDIIDHVDGVRSNNKPYNLRSVNISENAKNARLRADNTSGFCGVRFKKSSGKWLSRVNVDGKETHIGYFKSKEDAVSARELSNVKYGFHENHGKITANE